MEKEMPKIRVIDVETQQCLFECPLKDSEKAHAFAAEMDALGLSVKLVQPTLAQTLSHSLGLTTMEIAAYEESMEEEMEHHEGSCCFEDDSTKH